MNAWLTSKYLPISQFKWWYVFVAYVISMVVLIGLSVLGGVFGLEGSLGGKWAPCVQFILFAVLCIGFVWAVQGRPLASDWGLTCNTPKRLVVFIVLFAALFLGASYSLEMVFESMAKASKAGFVSLGLNDPSVAIPLILSVTVFAPIGEEFLYRGLMFRALRDGLTKYLPLKHTVLIAIILSALAFALSHGNTDQKAQLGALMLMGVLLALAYQLTGSFFVPVMIHSINNTCVLLMGAYMYKEATTVPPAMLCLIALGPVMTFGIMWGVKRVLPKSTQ